MTDDDLRLRRTVSLRELFRGTPPARIDGSRAPAICPAMELAQTLAEQARPNVPEDPMAKERETARRWFVPFPGVAGDVSVREPDRGDYIVDQMPPWARQACERRDARIVRWYQVDERIIIARTRTGGVLCCVRTDDGLDATIQVGRRPEVEE